MFYIFYRGYLSYFIYHLILAIVGVDVLLGLLFRPKKGMQCHFLTDEMLVGQPIQLVVEQTGGFFIPGGILVLEIALVNLLINEEQKSRHTLPRGKGQHGISFAHAAAQPGVFRLVAGYRTYDFLGLLPSGRRQLETDASILVLPPAYAQGYGIDLLDILGEDSPTSTRRESSMLIPGGSGEIREYRPGDSLKSIHWKLSLKLDDIFIKVPQDGKRDMVALYLDRRGPMERFTQNLSHLLGFSKELEALSQPYVLHWMEGDGTLREAYIHRAADLKTALWDVLSTPLLGEDSPSIQLADNPFGHSYLVGPAGVMHLGTGQLYPGGNP
ncbi:DUF58 domain-containing protein [Eubacteriales bacterium OttesenSCG-928-M02]|nr:DUF58 domain-containing protein [Eubacteriales bacterium OttesenSCG-928-M02]